MGSPKSLSDFDKENRLNLADKKLRGYTIKLLDDLAQLVEKALVSPRSGDFDAVIKDAIEAISQTELKQKYKNFLRVILFFQSC